MSIIEKIRNNYLVKNLIIYFLILVVSFLIILPFLLSDTHAGPDVQYHYMSIMSLDQAWNQGQFLSRIYDLICQDFGYGTGLFYSMLPASIAVVFMNIFNLTTTAALGIELLLLFSISGIIVYHLGLRLFKKNWIAILISFIYILFPYFLVNLYYRFAFSELFIMISFPLVVWGLIELTEYNNYKLFLLLFTLGLTLSILVHFTLAVYIAIFVFLFLLINIKKILQNFKYIPLLIACFLILCLSATFYIPMLCNFGVTNTTNMAKSAEILINGSIENHRPSMMFGSLIICIITMIVYIFIFIKKEKTLIACSLFILSLLCYFLLSPLCPWFLVPSPLRMIQFSHRLLMLQALFMVLQIGVILKNLDIVKLDFKKYKIFNYKSLVICFCCFLCLFTIFKDLEISSSANTLENSAINSNINKMNISGFSYNQGLGYMKNGDYYPKGASSEYIFNRANDSMIISTNSNITEFANYQTINQVSFLIDNNGDYVVLNIPFDVCNDIQVYQYSTDVYNKRYDNISISDDNGYLKINFSKQDLTCKIIISYPENSDFDNYLKENPFEFIVSSGSATFTNFVKNSSSNYSVSISTTEETKIELPTLYYNGYTATYKTSSGEYNLNIIQNENGFLQVTVKEDGVLTINFTATYVTVANWISIFGLILFLAILCVVFFVPRLYFTKLANKIDEWLKNHKNVAEFLRFLVVGTIATIVDLLVMGIVMYLMEKSIYDSFLNVFINTPTPSVGSTILGTSCGFIAGLLVNYVLSILFVFNEKGKSKSAKGFIIFTVLSAIGLGINALGTYIGFGLLGINQWLTKIVMIIIVLIYNYISKKLILFKGPKEIKFDNTKIKHEDDIIEDDINKNSSQENKN